MSAHGPSVQTYVFVFVALLLLAGLTTGVAYIDLGPFNTVIALFIAAAKMCLVALFFMHLLYSHGLTRVVAFAGLFWLALMIAGTLGDVVTRSWLTGP